MSEVLSIALYIYLTYLSFKFIIWLFNLSKTEDKIELIQQNINKESIVLTNIPDIKLSQLNKNKINKIKNDYKFIDLLIKEKRKHNHITVSVSYV